LLAAVLPAPPGIALAQLNSRIEELVPHRWTPAKATLNGTA